MSKKLAIKGHPTRGNEVIKLLEMMGGKNTYNLLGNDEKFIYYVIECNEIKGIPFIYDLEDYPDYIFFTLEEFLEKFSSKIHDLDNIPEYKSTVDIYSIFTCKTTGQGTYAIKIADGYRFNNIDENGNIIVKAIKSEYPSTYAECCEVLVGRKPNPNEISFDKMELCLVDLDNTQNIDFQNPYLSQLNSLFRLRMCREAYWKIAGEEMGLGKPWNLKYGCGEWGYWIGYDINANKIYCQDSRILLNHLLVFPTEEMRDAFYKNFKDLIEQCKELL